ncbi:H-type small acid-soluble spore protein [Sediminibacillus massiliensis]|uniref:H-type small acid-soluble spore protein n=1 Tax=Sediminibacillus massiliensis TaxID=1926277 RepID=UPI00098893A7|nr:H-type small acid-soluble spore protein [Sediminibacillus massiliensis]
MDKQRAMEIKESPDLINVTHHGDPIYIQRIDDQSGTAHVYSLQDPDNRQQVSIDELQEN